MRRLFAALLLLALFATPALAQAPPGTDLWMVPLSTDLSIVDATAAVNLTDRAGYDNQPAFTPDGLGVLYTSQRDGQTDIYRYDLATGTHQQFTDTPESEYSPLVTPAGDRISMIRVEGDGTQRLWSFTTAGTDPQLVLTTLQPVGYQVWADDHTLALFVLGSPPTLRLADPRTDTDTIVIYGVGRSLHRIPDEAAISYVHKLAEGAWFIRRLDQQTGARTTLAPTLPGREDYVWHPNGTLLMADGAVLYRWAAADGWDPVADFSAHNLTQISRLAVSPDGQSLVFVANR